MKAGRELDAVIAEKVMGLELERWNDVAVVKASEVGSPICIEHYSPEGERKPLHTFSPGTDMVPSYSTDIAAAWEVVERIRKMQRPAGGGTCDFSLQQMDRLEGGQWFVKTDKTFEDRQVEDGREVIKSSYVWVYAATAPHAICLAALKAVGA